MRRKTLDRLKRWKEQRNRKPLVIRGARQVGKTHLVRTFARESFDQLVEINFDREPDKASLFASSDVSEILALLQVDAGQKIVADKSLIFLDEIQAAPEVFPKLRYFYEEHPELHVIAAGSLLDFLLAEHTFAMPVGRIEYLHLGPVTFEEFLGARNPSLLAFIKAFDLTQTFPAAFHKTLMGEVRNYFLVGGMPAAMDAYIQTGDFNEVAREHQSILQSYIDDFPRYQRRADVHLLRKSFSKVPGLVGRKLKYVHIDPLEKAATLSKTLDLLELARIIYRVKRSAANRIPLAAEVNDRDFKPLFLDVGLLSASLGLKLTDLVDKHGVMLANDGALAEQFIGQHLLYSGADYEKPELYYWNREKRNSAAELDYVLSIGTNIIPVEVKSGKSGSLKSLHIFIEEKDGTLAVRFNSDVPSKLEAKTATASGLRKPFTLISLPLYMVGQTKTVTRTFLSRQASLE